MRKADRRRAVRMRDRTHRDTIDRAEHVGAHQLGGGAMREQAAALERDEFVAEAACHVDVVQHHDHTDTTLIAQSAHQRQHLYLMRDVERGNRLVKQQAFAVLGDRHRQPYTLSLAA